MQVERTRVAADDCLQTYTDAAASHMDLDYVDLFSEGNALPSSDLPDYNTDQYSAQAVVEDNSHGEWEESNNEWEKFILELFDYIILA
jgi:hypothetical protein